MHRRLLSAVSQPSSSEMSIYHAQVLVPWESRGKTSSCLDARKGPL